MHDNEDTAKYRSNIANEICVGGASSLAEVVFVYIDFLKIFYEENLSQRSKKWQNSVNGL